MGFDVTATHVIFFVAFLSAGSAVMGSFWSSTAYIEDSRRWEDDRIEDRAHTNMTVESGTYDATNSRFTVEIENAGSTVLDMVAFEYLIDGAIVSDSAIESRSVNGVTTTEILLPTETVTIQFNPVDSAPSYFMVVASNGVRANWGS